MGCSGSSTADKATPNDKGKGDTAKADSSTGGSKTEEKLLDKYTLGAMLGQGAFGVVYACTKRGTKPPEEYAVKMIDKVESHMSDIKREVDMLTLLTHPTIIRLVDVFWEKVFVYMVTDIYKGGDMIAGMQDHWKGKGMIPMDAIKNVSAQMIKSIAWCHAKNVVHRDVKGDNFLMDKKKIEDLTNRIYLSDFGTVKEIGKDERLNHSCGTKIYWSPEFYKMSYGQKVDVWAIGVVMFGLVTGKFPFKGEPDVKSKEINLPSRCPELAQDLLKKMLIKDEGKRIEAQQASEHKWFGGDGGKAATTNEVADPTMSIGFVPEIAEAGAGAGIKERRRELVERLENAKNSTAHISAAKVDAGYEVTDKSDRTACFAWWPQDKFKPYDTIATGKAVAASDDMKANVEQSTDQIKQMLTDHGIKTKAFGVDGARSFEEFNGEIQNGSARIMLDATRHKTVVRVVDVVLLRLFYKPASGGGKVYLVQLTEANSKGFEKKDLYQLAGTKKNPHENGKQVCLRVLEERLGLKELQVNLNFASKEDFEETEDSPSYPGVHTVYRKEIIEGQVMTTDPAVLKKVGCSTKDGRWRAEDSKKVVRTFAWLDESRCQQKKVKLRAPRDATDISALVHPPIGLNSEELTTYLTANGFDVTLFGKDGCKSLKDFSDELVKGEATLSRTADGKVSRIVDVVIVRLQRPNGDLLIEASEKKSAAGIKKDLNRLPAVKRRSDENQFLAAHRVFSKVLKIDENHITIDVDGVMIAEEESSSKSYGGLRTYYRKRIIKGTFVTNP